MLGQSNIGAAKARTSVWNERRNFVSLSMWLSLIVVFDTLCCGHQQ
jgi:hypothetical protein